MMCFVLMTFIIKDFGHRCIECSVSCIQPLSQPIHPSSYATDCTIASLIRHPKLIQASRYRSCFNPPMLIPAQNPLSNFMLTSKYGASTSTESSIGSSDTRRRFVCATSSSGRPNPFMRPSTPVWSGRG